MNHRLDPDNAYNNYIPEQGLAGGTVKDGSDDEKFLFGKMVFDIQKARDCGGLVPNSIVPVSQKWIDKVKVFPRKAMKSNSSKPVFIAQIHTDNGVKPLLIDGNHRMYKAIQDGKETIPAHVFTPEESEKLMLNSTSGMKHDPAPSVLKNQPSRSSVHVNAPLEIKKEAGYSGDELEKVSRAELITFPTGVIGVSCENCKFRNDNACEHPAMMVELVDGPDSMCCDYWDETGTKHWGSNVQKDVAVTPDIYNDGAKLDTENIRAVSTVAVQNGDHMLMGKRRDNGKWTVPGGHVEDGEDHKQAAIRELKEETGIHLKPHQLESMSNVDKISLGDKKYDVQAFKAKVDHKINTSMLGDPDGEVDRWRWINTSKGLPEEILNNLHVPAERNVLMRKLGLVQTTKTEVGGMADNALAGLYDMQQLVDGMDWEIENGTTADHNLAKEIAMVNLEDDADYYRKLRAEAGHTDDKLQKDTQETEDSPTAGEGFKLDLGSGTTRESGHIGLDTYPYDYGTVVHDINIGIPFPDSSASHVRAVNSLHEVSDDQKPVLSEIMRVLMPGGQFLYEGPNEIINWPSGLVQTNYESNEEDVQKIEGNPAFRQTFERVATPDPATADDAEPRIGVAQYDMLPADALLAMDALGYYFSDATSSGRGNRLHGYPSQGALVDKKKSLLQKLKDFVFRRGPVDNTGATSDDSVNVAMAAMEDEVDKGGPGSGRQGTGQKQKPKTVIVRPDSGYGRILQVTKASSNDKSVPIFKADKMKQIVYGVVLEPHTVDSQEDWMTPEDIEKAAHGYLQNSRVIGKSHTSHLQAAYPVESYIAPQDFETTDGQYGPQKITKGSWILAVKIEDPAEWEKVMNGEYTGFSVGGFGLREPGSPKNGA
jgi:ADP-ribose pyrophosphatase YjhB (NUDIX family)/SAM-dependent methyltransferase